MSSHALHHPSEERAAAPKGPASSHAHSGSPDGGNIVESLNAFLHAWTVKQQRAVSESPPPPASSCDDYLDQFPPPLSAQLPRSFRPCEMVPAVYLGSWSDVGTDVVALIHRLQEATSDRAAENALPMRAAAPQQMALLIRACPLPGVMGPQLELHVARARKSGTRRAPAAPSAFEQRLAKMAPPVRQPASTTGETLGSVHDVEVMHISLTDLYRRVCAALGSDSSSASPSSRSTLAQWLCPDAPAIASPPAAPSSATCRGSIPAQFSREEWKTCVGAVQEVLLGDSSACMGSIPATWRDVHLYWRLVLPILDSPTVPIQQYFALTTLVMHAALSLKAHSNYTKWLSGEVGAVGNADTTPVNGEDAHSACVATKSERADSVAAAAQPCVVVHCQAGKSRSVSFVAAFLLQEWMMWYRVTQSQPTAGKSASPSTGTELPDNAHETPAGCAASSTTAAPSTSQAKNICVSTTARRLVDTVIAHLRRRRLCVDVNLGFDAQLHAIASAFIGDL
ncbi:hypothetical protein ABL78_4540 [Leptomonas seymouri]|uniref:Tyrosine specific protein phosphatases domain-containing protein n=1 Tax=Leptomonas seymouri TaxID=5684 RepID=A0A0N0P5F1_LEPSE|nr:hypothetical protein ABL78_4540 [Leptomonas seymouri]|eukprot:KPI86389.1 hypothetical protein ABL78_4540 [Leptomonas seymouri]